MRLPAQARWGGSQPPGLLDAPFVLAALGFNPADTVRALWDARFCSGRSQRRPGVWGATGRPPIRTLMDDFLALKRPL